MSDEKKLIEDICKIESSHGEVYEHIRTKVMKEGKALRELQKLQKEQQKQAKERGEEPQTWKDYLAEKKRDNPSLPEETMSRYYMRISQYPASYEKGMSVKEAYKNATAWKKNGGTPPPLSKVSIQNRLPARVGVACGRLQKVLEKWNAENWLEVMEQEKWSNDEVIGLSEVMAELRQDLNQSIRKLNSTVEVQK